MSNKNETKSDSLTEIFCNGCKEKFASKTALFRHLRASEGKCFSPEEYKDFVKYFINSDSNREKVMILYGYIPGDYYLSLGLKNNHETIDPEAVKLGVCDGQHASQLLLEAIESVSYEGEIDEEVKASKINTRPNRSYGHFARASGICAQDELSGAVTEVLTTRAPPLFIEDCSKAETSAKEEEATKKWIEKVNQVLNQLTTNLAIHANVEFPGKVKVFGRLQAPKKFNAEMDVIHRRIDYLFPADVIFGTAQIAAGTQMGDFLESIETFHPGRNTEYDEGHGHNFKNDIKRQDFTYVYKIKRLMQKFCTPVVDLDMKDEGAVMAKAFHKQKRMNQGKGSKNHKSNESTGKRQDQEKETTTTSEEAVENILEKQGNKKGEKERVLKRKRFHNFTRMVMAHEFLAFRRIDKFFHRATLRFDGDDKDEDASSTKRNRPYIVLSAKGDLFLDGQARGMVGLLIAIVRGYIDEAILECVFDEDYPNLVPCPFAPATGLFAGEVNYANWEGRMNAVLTPRHNDRWKKGWKSQEIITTIEDFQQEMYKSIARAWDPDNASLDKDLPPISNWITNCLEPWSIRAKEQYNDYCKWKKAKEEICNDENTEIALMEKLTPPLSSVSSEIPTLYQKVLDLLREADRGNLWPSTTPKRQLVMVSTSENDNPNNKSTSLALQHLKAKSNTYENSSAYGFKEGQGGASGSFSVGAMPGVGCEPPKGNTLFPELMKAAFELEIALCPEREPSSTIAVNRNAQFRPHIDSGAGAGQSRSLIVGLGTYSGGELLVEGEKRDIRYKPLQFNGWRQRHWTRPFLGERYSLVWFTQKGCEGVHGIDLCEQI